MPAQEDEYHYSHVCDESYEMFVEQEEKEFSDWMNAMDKRTHNLEYKLCPNCNHKGLQPISITESHCYKCNTTFQI